MKRITLVPLIMAIVIFIIFPFKELQLISIAIIIFYLYGFLFSKIITKFFVVSRNRDIQYCKNSEDEYVSLFVKNKAPFILNDIEVYDKGSGCFSTGDGEYITSIDSGETVKFDTRVTQVTRGLYKVGPVVIKGIDPLKLFPWSISIDSSIDVVVYPKISPINSILVDGERGGSIKVKNPIYQDLTDLKSIRDFRTGDSIKNINWKSTAKTGKLQVMEFSNTINTPLFILLDVNGANYPVKYRYTYLEKAIETAASIVTEYSLKGQPIGIFISGLKDDVLVPIFNGYEHTVSILERLALLDPSKSESLDIVDEFFKKNYSIPQGSHLYAITPGLSKESVPLLNIFKRSKVLIHTVYTGHGDIDPNIPYFNGKFKLSIYDDKEVLNAI